MLVSGGPICSRVDLLFKAKKHPLNRKKDLEFLKGNVKEM
jgi:hypothetical protein